VWVEWGLGRAIRVGRDIEGREWEGGKGTEREKRVGEREGSRGE